MRDNDMKLVLDAIGEVRMDLEQNTEKIEGLKDAINSNS